MKTERGLALQDLLIGAYEYVDDLDLKPHARVYLLDFLATTEYVHPSPSLPVLTRPAADIACLLGRTRKFS